MFRLSTASLLTACLLAGCNTPTEDIDSPGLYRLSSCNEFRDYIADVALETALSSRYSNSWGWGVDDMSESSDGGDSGPTDYTTTNVQEQGVDEIDLVKTDGQYMYVAQDRAFHIVDSWPVEDAEHLATVELDGWVRGMFLHKDNVVIFHMVHNNENSVYRYGYGTRISVFNVSDRTNPTLTRKIDIDGYLADGRMIDGDVYAVLNHWSRLPEQFWDLAWSEDLPEVDWSLSGEMLDVELAIKRKKARKILEPKIDAMIADLDLTEVLPKWQHSIGDTSVGDPTVMHQCSDLYRPYTTGQMNILSLVSLDMDDLGTSTTGIVSDGWNIYASKDSLYVAQTSWWWWWGWGDMDFNTRIHKFELKAGSAPEYTATGEVRGWVYDQFAFSEHDGHLRVTTTDIDWWWGINEEEEEIEPGNNLFVLKDDGAGELATVGSVTGYAPGERIMSSRLLGDKGYVITFRQVDPLFTFDLSNPTAPKIMGELKMPGFSSYLHPLGDDYLLGVGRDGNEEGQVFGIAINLFDVRDLKKPLLIHQHTLNTGDWTWSEALWDHHAFTFHRNVLTIPLYSWENDERFSGLVSISVDADAGLEEIGRVDHRTLVEQSECLYAKYYDYDSSVCKDWGWYASVRRSVYIEDNLFSISNYGIRVNDLNAPENELGTVLFYPDTK